MKTVMIYDACMAPGGAHTSLGALVAVLSERGVRSHLVLTSERALHLLRERIPARAHNTGLVDMSLIPDPRSGSIHGAAYAAREFGRLAGLLELSARVKPTHWLNNNVPQVNAAGTLAASRLKIPRAQYIRGDYYRGKLARALLSHNDAIFTVGSVAADDVGERALPIGEGLDERDAPLHRTPDARGFFWSAGLATWKGVHFADRVHKELGEDAPRMVMAYMRGSSPNGADLPPAQRSNLELHDSPSNLDDLRAGCDVFVHTSLKPEPFGRSILEAMSAGLCPVVPDNLATELVTHGVHGMVYRAGQERSLRRVLTMLSRHPSLARQLGEAARMRALALGDPYRSFSPVLRWLLDDTIEKPARASTRRPIFLGL